ncbi:uncharacterized protein LOC143050962 isoform X2 [Mytilus galloprovincialis]|uniref:uncharacterized protein LOC143050962 isoform X2 n=1 Tax=Mytilus galloprovincialis TaxID=29158 RepID=UPI003F7BE423
MLLFLLYGFTCLHLSVAVTCYKCDSVDQPAHCYQTANCQAGQICMVSQNPKLNGDLFFNLGCFSKSTCQYFNIVHGVGRRILVSSPSSITKCCDTDNCNKDLLCPGGICAPPTTQQPLVCEDHVIDCNDQSFLSAVCGRQEAQYFCKKSCKKC